MVWRWNMKMAGGNMSSNVLSTNKCKKCKQTASSGVKCVNCETVTHKSCAGYLKHVKFIDDNTINSCKEIDNEDLDSTFIDPADEEYRALKVEIKYLKKILRHKDLIINNQNDLILSLKDQVNLLNKNLNTKEMPSLSHKNKSTNVSNSKDNKVISVPN